MKFRVLASPLSGRPERGGVKLPIDERNSTADTKAAPFTSQLLPACPVAPHIIHFSRSNALKTLISYFKAGMLTPLSSIRKSGLAGIQEIEETNKSRQRAVDPAQLILHGLQCSRQRLRLARCEAASLNDRINSPEAQAGFSSDRPNTRHPAADPRRPWAVPDGPEFSHYFLGSHGLSFEIYGSDGHEPRLRDRRTDWNTFFQ
jgi:hypothetical protein